MSDAPRLAYQPALDGVRALAVIAVLLFHAGTPGFDGGYLGVSVFFTLSGYLITSLLLREHALTGTIDLRGFYGRRLRRLLPASVLTVGAIVLIAAATDVFDGVSSLRADVLGALFQVANWVFLAGEGSYQDLLAQAGTPSPLEHFWSLAIEEQFYWIWPVTMLAVLSRVTTRHARVAVVGALTVAFMVAAPLIAQVWGPDAAYWSTPARLSEILVGAFLALVLLDRDLPDVSAWLAPVALTALAVATVTFPTAGGPAYAGALPLVAVASGLLLVGLQTDGPLRRALSTAPLVGLGKISYGVYLFHWPVYVIADAPRVGVDGAALTVVRLAITLAISVASYQLIEQPIRRARGVTFAPTLGGSALATGAVALAAVAVVPTGLGDYWQTDDDVAEAAAIEVDEQPLTAPVASSTSQPATSAAAAEPSPDSTRPDPTPASVPATTGTTADDSATTDGTTTVPGTGGSSTEVPATTAAPTVTTASTPSTLPPIPELARPVRIVVTGDSTAEALGTGVVGWAAAHPELAQAEVQAAPGCGFVMGGERKYGDSTESVEGCTGWVEAQLYPLVERTRPDVVVVMVTTWDLIDRRWDTEELLAPMDQPYRDRIEVAYTELADRLVDAGAGRVAFVREPVPDVWWLEKVDDEDEPERHHVLYDVYDEIAASRPDTVSVIPFADWFSDAGYDRDEDIRPDGIHLTPETSTAITDAYLGEQFIRAALGMPTRTVDQ